MPSEFFRWRLRLGLSRDEVARRLGYGIRKVAAWDRGEETPRLVVRLAMAAVENELAPVAA